MVDEKRIEEIETRLTRLERKLNKLIANKQKKSVKTKVHRYD